MSVLSTATAGQYQLDFSSPGRNVAFRREIAVPGRGGDGRDLAHCCRWRIAVCEPVCNLRLGPEREDGEMSRHDLILAIQQLITARSEADTAAASALVKALAPHARISDMIFYPEKERTTEEIADEAMERERVWREGGDSELNRRIADQMETALKNTAVPAHHHTKTSARMILNGVRTIRLN